MATSDAVKSLFPSLKTAPTSVVDSNTTTSQVGSSSYVPTAPAPVSVPTTPTPTVATAPSPIMTPVVTTAPKTTVATPPPFTATVPTTMDSGVVATSLSEPASVPQIPETKVFQMADGRFYNPTTGVSGMTKEEALGLGPSTSGPSPTNGLPEAPGPDGTGTTVVEDDVTATIKALFPESESLVKQYGDLRKSSGLEADEAALAAATQEVNDMQAVIDGIEDEVRAQAGGAADESFIQATIADRMRRLMPQINRINARYKTLSANVETKKANITEQIGLRKEDIGIAAAERREARDQIREVMDTYGSAVFTKMSPELVAELEKRAGYPPGTLRSKTFAEQERDREETVRKEEKTDAVTTDTRRYLLDIAAKYPDAGIDLDDTLKEAADKIAASKTYKDETAGEDTTDIREFKYAVEQGYKGTFMQWQKDQANLSLRASGGRAPTQAEKDQYFLEGAAKNLDASRGADGYVNTDTYGNMFQQYGMRGGRPEEFFNVFPTERYLNPNDPTARFYLEKEGTDSLASLAA